MGGQRTRLREALLFDYFVDRAKVFQLGGKQLHERGRGFGFLVQSVRFHFNVFAVLCRGVLSLSYISK